MINLAEDQTFLCYPIISKNRQFKLNKQYFCCSTWKMNPDYLCGVEKCKIAGNSLKEIIEHLSMCHGNVEIEY